MVPVLQQAGQVELVVEPAQHLDALSDRLDHAELDRVVHQLDEVARRRGAGVEHGLVVDREITQHGCDHVEAVPRAADHERRAVPAGCV